MLAIVIARHGALLFSKCRRPKKYFLYESMRLSAVVLITNAREIGSNYCLERRCLLLRKANDVFANRVDSFSSPSIKDQFHYLDAVLFHHKF